MEPTNNDQLLHEIHRLTRENNEMMHRMRRSAFLWGFIKFIIYAALLTAPIWFYLTYLNGAVEQMLQAMSKIEGANAQVQNQFTGLQGIIQKLEAPFSASSTSAK
jgi:hypothetical protein